MFPKTIKEQNIKSEVILISGIEDIIQSINAFELGIVDFLTKPVNMKKLLSLIRKYDNKIDNENVINYQKNKRTEY